MIPRKNICKLGSISVIIILVCSGLATIIPNFHDQNNANANAASVWSQDTGKNFKNGTLENVSVYGSGEDAELKINLTEYQTWTRITRATKPYTGYYQEMASIWGDDKVMLFGGYGYYNATWIYDLSDKAWTVRNIPNSPPARYWQAMASIWGDDKVLLYGGYTSAGYAQDTWVYDSSDGTWTNKQTSGPTPYYTYGHNMATIWGTKKVMMFDGIVNETWVYDLTNNSWTKQTPDESPGMRYYHSVSSIYGTDKVLLYGGQYGSYFDDTWVYDYSDDAWTELSPKGNPGTKSYPALFSVYGTDQLVLYGGWWYNYEDVWVYDFSANKWFMKIPQGSNDRPVAGWYHAMAPVYNTDQAVLFGGYYTYYMDDTWIYRHHSKIHNGTYTSGAYDTGASTYFKTIAWDAEVPANTSLRLQLRTAENEEILNSKPFVGPDGKTDSYYTSSPTTIWPEHYGDRWIQCKVLFNINYFIDTLSLDEIKIIYNCIPDIEVLSPIDGIHTANNKPLFSWTFIDFDSEVQDAFQVVIDNDIEFESIDFDSGKQTTTNNQWQFPSGTNFTTVPDGSWYWKVRTRDDDDMWTKYSEPRRIVIDSKPPNSATIKPINNGYYQDLNTISGIANDPTNGSGLLMVELAIKNVNDNFYWNGKAWGRLVTWLTAHGTDNWTFDSGTISWHSGKQYAIQSRAIDVTGNIEFENIDTLFTIDRDRPISRINTPTNNIWLNSLDTITGSSMDISGAGIKNVKINIKCSKDLNLWDNLSEKNLNWGETGWGSYDSWITANGTDTWWLNTSAVAWSSGNQYVLRPRATDNTGNEEQPGQGITFNYDDEPPVELSILINNDESFTSNTEVMLSVSAKDYGSELLDMSFSADGSEWSDWIPFSSLRSFNLPDGDGQKTVYFRVRDIALNIAEPVSDTIFLDTTPPAHSAIVINNDAQFTKSNVVNLTLYAEDALSGVSQMTFSFDKVKWFPWENFQYSKILAIPFGSGEKIVYFRTMDNTNNIALEVHDTIILDSNKPFSTSIFINKGAKKTNSTTVELNLNAYDDYSGIDEIAFSLDGQNWSDWEPFITEKLFTIPAGDGEKTIYLKARDKAGNVGDQAYATIELNTSTETIVESSKPNYESSNELEFWHILLILIAGLILSFVLLTTYFTKRLKRLEQQMLMPGSLTIKPGTLGASMVSAGALSGSMAAEQLTSGSVGAPISGVFTGAAAPTPILAKSTETAQVQAAGAVQHPKLPQLPPAKVQEQEKQEQETNESAEPPQEVQQEPQTQPAQQQYVQTAQPQVTQVDTTTATASTATATPTTKSTPVPTPTPVSTPAHSQATVQPQPQQQSKPQAVKEQRVPGTLPGQGAANEEN